MKNLWMKGKEFKAVIFTAAFLICVFINLPAHAACTSPTGATGEQIYNTSEKMMQFCNGADWVAMSCGSGQGSSPCTPGEEGEQIYNVSQKIMQFCDGTNWIAMGCFEETGQCALPWGGTIGDGQSTIAYLNASEPSGGSCTSETRNCTTGTLSGTYTNETCGVGTLGNITFSPALIDSLNNRGQAWRYSNTVTFNSSGLVRIDGSVNTGYRLNGGSLVSMNTIPGYEQEINVSAGDTIQLAGVHGASGGSCSFPIAIVSLAGTFNWQACAKDYGSNNCTNYRQGTCSGTMLQSVTVTSGTSTSNPGGCIDLAQEMGAAAGCIEYENVVPQHYCEIYSGSHVAQPGSINTITCNN